MSFYEKDVDYYVEAAVEESVTEAKVEEAASDHEALAAAGNFLGAIETLSAVVEAEPDDQNHHQRMVEYAFRSNDSGALAEYQQALRASADHLPTYELLGQTFLEKSEPEAALRSLTRALDAPYEVEDELMGIHYYLGMTYEAVGNKDQTLEFYDRVFSLDINFADVTERLRALRD